MADTRAESATCAGRTGQSVRCTERPPVSPRQISSLTSGASGAMTSVSTRSTVASVSKAGRATAASSLVKRVREVRRYQLVSRSMKSRTVAVASVMS